MAKKKVLTQEGVQRLWAAIEAKFIDVDEADFDANYEPMSNAEIDAITGYEEPVVEEEEPQQESNNDPEEPNNEEG